MTLRDEFEEPDLAGSLDIENGRTLDIDVDLGLSHDDRSAHPFSGGEAAAWERLNHYIWDSRALGHYKQTRNKLIGTDYSCKMSAYLALGCISPVSIANTVRNYEFKFGSNTSTYWLLFELMWRDFFRPCVGHG